ncbi:glycosyltransferase [Candidatus Peregrinibacteria bacterium]|nr:glycosyltransferase [Candidatus Peregrinibacteria bacterium]
MKINLISETTFTVQGHGVHTAFIENRDALKNLGIDVQTNSKKPCDIIHVHTVGPYSLYHVLKNRGKVVITAHVIPDSFVGSLRCASTWYPLAKKYLHFFYNQANAIIAVSPEVKRTLRKWGIQKKIYIIPNGVNRELFKRDKKIRQKMRKKFSFADHEFVVINSGQIQPRKGIETFIKMAKSLPDVKFLWVGGIPFKNLAQDYKKMKKIENSAPKNVFFTGTVPFENMPNYYSAADMLFFPSHQETFGFAIIEAAAAKLPLLMRNLQTFQLIFGDAFIGGNDTTFKKIIMKLKTNKKFYNEYSSRAINLAKKFDDKMLAKKIIKVYKEVQIMNIQKS